MSKPKQATPDQDDLDRLTSRMDKRMDTTIELPAGNLPLTGAQLKAVRDAYNEFRDQHGLSHQEVSKRIGSSGFSAPTLSVFSTCADWDLYNGDPHRVARGLHKWMPAYLSQVAASRPPDFIETRTSKRILGIIDHARQHRSMAVIVGPAGIGKTMTMQQVASLYPGTLLVRAHGFVRSPAQVCRALLRELHAFGSKPGKNAGADMCNRLVELLSDTGRLVLIDEAHQIREDGLEIIRTLHDLAGVPIVLAGTIGLERSVDDYDLHLGQFASRVSLHHNPVKALKPRQKLFGLPEVREIVRQYAECDDGAVAYLHAVANQIGFGSLRLCRQLMIAAARTTDSVVSREHLQRVHLATRGHSDSSTIFRRKVDEQLGDPTEQREAG